MLSHSRSAHNDIWSLPEIVKMSWFFHKQLVFLYVALILIVISHTAVQSDTGDETQAETSDSSTPDRAPPEQSRKRKRKTDVSDMMVAFKNMQKQKHEEFMQREQLRHQQEKEMLKNWMKAQMEMEEHQQQLQRKEHQAANRMLSRLQQIYSCKPLCDIREQCTTLSPLVQGWIAEHSGIMDFAQPTHIVPESKLMVHHTLPDDRMEAFTIVVVCRAVNWN